MRARAPQQLDARGIADELVAPGAALDLSRLPSRFPYLLVTPQYETERVREDRRNR